MKKVLLSDRSLQLLFGPLDENIRFLENLFGVAIQVRDSSLTIDGEEANINALEKILVDFSALADKGHSITNGDLQSAFKQIAEDAAPDRRKAAGHAKEPEPETLHRGDTKE